MPRAPVTGQIVPTYPNATPDEILSLIGAEFENEATEAWHRLVNQITVQYAQSQGDTLGVQQAWDIARERVGYESVKYSYMIAERAEKMFGVYHPVLGPVVERKDLTTMQTMTAGYLLGKLQKEGYKLEETMLYYPLRKNLCSISYLLDHPETDPIIGPLSIMTMAEQKEIDDKSNAFFDNLKS